jgi:hypothetical protein
MAHQESAGRVALLAGAGAALIAGSFAYLHSVVLLDWPAVAVDGWGPLLAYFTTGFLFQFGTPVLCLTAFLAARRTQRLWTARMGIACAITALAGYALYVHACLEMIR